MLRIFRVFVCLVVHFHHVFEQCKFIQNTFTTEIQDSKQTPSNDLSDSYSTFGNFDSVQNSIDFKYCQFYNNSVYEESKTSFIAGSVVAV